MIRRYAFLAGLDGRAGDPFLLAAYVDQLVGEMLMTTRNMESN